MKLGEEVDSVYRTAAKAKAYRGLVRESLIMDAIGRNCACIQGQLKSCFHKSNKA